MLLQKVVAGNVLSIEEASKAVNMALEGSLTPVETAALLAALRVRGETPEELAGVVLALRSKAVAIQVPKGIQVSDTCGTGGDGLGTFNVSTAVALVVAGAGLPVAKHGNRAISSSCGSADVLEALGVRVTMSPPLALRCLMATGMTFLYAPHFHPALNILSPVRRQLGIRTILNLAGPLVNPLRPTFQIVGVPDPALVPVVARAISLGSRARALVVHGDGMDELSPFGTNLVAFVSGRRWRVSTLSASGLVSSDGTVADLRVTSASDSADMIRSVLAGVRGPARNTVVINAAALLWLAGRSPTLGDAVAIAQESIDSGRAAQTLTRLIDGSNWEETDVNTGEPS